MIKILLLQLMEMDSIQLMKSKSLQSIKSKKS